MLMDQRQRFNVLLAQEGLNQEGLASKIDMDVTKLNRIINGKYIPTPPEMHEIAQALGVSPEELFHPSIISLAYASVPPSSTKKRS